MKQITLAMFAMFVVQQVNAQNKNEFTLIQAVDYGMKNSAQVKNALLDIKIQHETNREFTANAYPQLNGNAGVTHFFNIDPNLVMK